MRNTLAVAFGLVVASSPLAANPKNYEWPPEKVELIATLNRGKSCSVASFDKNQLNCTYVVGSDLIIEIAGVGARECSISFPKVNESDESKFTATVGLSDGCIRVNSWPSPGSGGRVIVFISPKDGKVYPSPGAWCR